ncbi:MAG TPA: SDR family NAD(P)-dependent oxidoreductase [Calditrichaeota bacterium]|nr:SDR family NAD(P)-dependent oxidoreductase [Calditrichota bacterium]
MKHIVIVGATSGIGLALTRLCLQKGFRVGGCGRFIEALEQIKTQYPHHFEYTELDIRQTESIPKALDILIRDLGGMDICLVSSGIGGNGAELNWEEELNVIQTNVTGYAAVLNYGAQYFIKAGGGHLAGITSLTKYFGFRNAAYNASKAFEAVYLESLRLKLERYGIAVTEIVPGFVQTPMVKENVKMFWLVGVEKAAHQILSALEKRKKVVYISKRWRLIRWILPFLPYAVIRFLYTKEQKLKATGR